MPLVIRARVYGFCMGVRRAMETATDAAEKRSGAVYTLGPLIHNPTALEGLASRGVGVLDEAALPADLSGATVVIRAHGVPPAVADAVAAAGAELIDATCPRVRRSQKKAADYAKAGKTVFLAGEARHGEIIGIAGYAPGCIVVSTPAEARAAAAELHAASPNADTALIGQTTIKKSEYDAIAAEITAFFPSLEVFDGICPATADRQKALVELLGAADAVVVVGGKNSANTKRLYLTAVEHGKPAWLVETADDLTDEMLAYERIGLTAGASTPDAVIDAVETRLLGGTSAFESKKER